MSRMISSSLMSRDGSLLAAIVRPLRACAEGDADEEADESSPSIN